MKKLLVGAFSLFLLGVMPLASCDPTIITSVTYVTVSGDSAYEGGKEGNESLDPDPALGDDNAVKQLFTAICDVDKYSYELTMNLANDSSTFTQYFTRNAWYVDYGNSSSFGYAQDYDTKEVFKYYMDGEDIYPSVYEYAGYYDLERLTDLYSWISISTVWMLEDTLDTLSYQIVGLNSYVITDSDSMSVFQYMTTYGSSITDYISAFYVDIIDLESLSFTTSFDLGAYGEITGKFTALDSTPIDAVNEGVIDGSITGVTSNDVVAEACNLIAGNNYTVKGINVSNSTFESSSYAYNIYCTPEYFYFSYEGEYDDAYPDFGYAFIPANTTVPVLTDGVLTEYCVDYDACYSFTEDPSGNLYFDVFVGPIESDGTYLSVDVLPATGETGILYIVEEDGEKLVYEWVIDEETGTGSYNLYSSWYDNVGEFYIYQIDDNGNIATSGTFYPSAGAFLEIAPMMMEKADFTKENETNFVSTATDVEASLAQTIFGVGFQPTTTWMDYISEAFMNVTYEGETISEVRLGLGVNASSNQVYETQYVSYDFMDFGTTSHSVTETFLAPYFGGSL